MEFFIFIQILIDYSKLLKQIVEIVIRRRVFAASDMGLHCLLMSHKKEAGRKCVKY